MRGLMALAAGLFTVGVLSTARADTLRKMRRPIQREGWHGCGEPPADMQPRPKFTCGQKVIDTSTGKARKREVTELSASQDRRGQWHWAYILDDGTAALAATLQAAEGK